MNTVKFLIKKLSQLKPVHIILIAFFLTDIFCFAYSHQIHNKKNKVHYQETAVITAFSAPRQEKVDSIINFAKSYLGKPYKEASCGPDGFDCSGFIYYIFKKFNINLSRSSYTMAEEGEEVADTSLAQKGDLIFFQGTDLSDPKVGHVGLIISEKGEPISFIHSSSNKKNNGIIITGLNERSYRKRFVKIKRVLEPELMK